jgi:NAD(P)-dependent dehydrogenase (short-subunit alcohol dehydrogenase family)
MPAEVADLFSLTGHTAIVTGASRGIGFALADALAAAGATVFALARSERPSAPFARDVEYRTCDVKLGIEAVCEEVAQRHGRLDVLVNAAGITTPGTADAQQLVDFDEALSVNLRAVYAACLAAEKRMQAGGSIVNVTSIGSILGFPNNPGYVASKGGVRMLTKALAVDLGPRGIRVNSLAPGYIRTNMTERSFQDARAHEARRRQTCLGRWGTTDDLVGAAIFLASRASAYITGQDIVVDGGWTAKGLVE